MNLKKLFITIGCTLFIGGLFAQPVFLNPLTSTENIYRGAVAGNNSGNDIAYVNTMSSGTQYVNVMVYEILGGSQSRLVWDYITSAGNGTVLPLGNGLLGATISDPDVVAVVSNISGLGNLKENLLVTYIAVLPGGVANTYLEMFSWDMTTSTFIVSGGPFNLTQNPSTGVCATPNVDADYMGNYSVVWEENTFIYTANGNALSAWNVAPNQFVNHTSTCHSLNGEANDPDVCLIPDGTGRSLINVAFRVRSQLILERIWTSQLSTGLINFPSANCPPSGLCTGTMFFLHDFVDNINFPGKDMIDHIRIACPPTLTTNRSFYDLTMAFTYKPNNSDVITGTHNEITFGLGSIVFNTLNLSGSSYPAQGSPYDSKKPAVAYKLNTDEFVVGFEFSDGWTFANNAYDVRLFTNQGVNLVAVRCSDANLPLNMNMSSVNNVNNSFSTANAVSISRGDISPMQYAFVDGAPNAVRYNSTFTGVSLKKQPDAKYWFVVKPQSSTNLVEINESMDFSVFPNPTLANNGAINISLAKNTSTEIHIHSTDGKLVFQEKFENTSQISIPNELETGSYIIQIKTNNNSFTKKLIVN